MSQSDKYAHLLIRRYRSWGLYLNENQSYLGRCVLWCYRESAFELTDVDNFLRGEMLVIIDDWSKAVREQFGADWCNYAFLGNVTRHLHGHLIPRYSKPVEFAGQTFTDEHWGQNYQTDPDHETAPRVFAAILETLRKNLE